MKITVLGCGASGGVPVLGSGWGECDKNNPKNRRTRSSIIIEMGNTKLLVDMSPDLRQQLLDYGSSDIDAVILTHGHYDHTNGLNELRSVFYNKKNPLCIYSTFDSIEHIKRSFYYLFNDESSISLYKPYLKAQIISENFVIGDIEGMCLDLDHGYSKTIGIRVGDFAYTTDVVKIGDEVLEKLKGLDVWIVDCLSFEPKPTHAHLDLVMQWIEKIQPKITYLTHMSFSMDYDKLIAQLPSNVRPAYDQMILEL